MEKNSGHFNLVLQLKRLQNNRGWIYGIIMENQKIICDTLEIEMFDNLPEGIYRILSELDSQHKNTNLVIYGSEGEEISKLIAHNSIVYKNIQIRLDNNYVTVGVKTQEPMLLRSHEIFKNIFDYIRSLEQNNTFVFIEIINQYKKTP